jgi:hypothetical protein
MAASAALYRVKDRAFAAIRERLAGGVPTSEYQIQQLMAGWIKDEGLVSVDLPVVASMENAANPHYMPPPTGSRPIGRDELVLLDLWGKQGVAGAVYADITWVCFTGAEPPQEFQRAFDAIVRARDAAVAVVERAARAGADLRGWQVDQASRQVLFAAGYGDHVLHRTGHSLGTEVHGNGVHMDDYETHDDRRLIGNPLSGATGLPIAQLLMPAVQAAFQAQARMARNMAALQAIEALRMHAATSGGKLPASLSDVTIVPVPKNPATGQPFPYQYDAVSGAAALEAPGINNARDGKRYVIRMK